MPWWGWALAALAALAVLLICLTLANDDHRRP